MSTPGSAASAALDRSRLERLRAAIGDAGCDAALLYDPINVRYATGTSNMQVYASRNPCRYALVPADGDVVLFEFKGCEHLSDGHPNVAEVRPAVSWYDFVSGHRTHEMARIWAVEIVALLGGGTDLAVDRLDPIGTAELEGRGIRVHDGQAVANRARRIKTDAELAVVRRAVEACESGIAAMHAAMRPGMTEQELWANLHHANIASGGEWLETRLLTSGRRTNPWYQECSSKVIGAGELVAFDTDLIGVGGYSVDVSRTWISDGAAPTDDQRRLWEEAAEQLVRNTELLRPGASFLEISRRAHVPPEGVHSVTNAAVAHGIGLCNEYPLIVNRDHVEAAGYDGEIEVGMVLCVEALAAPPGGSEAVKLEEQVLITADGPEPLSTSPLALVP
ncbi:M24 family metallopeptidase [Ilumatobacter sp.]|uniref:M24 family metallopeptidase n=1 Tax=Ilumatobacter sp. TaxID=1967498 RepID=UPI003B51658F